MPSSAASRRRALTTSAPARWPSTTGRPRCWAQRPLPSVMIATYRARAAAIRGSGARAPGAPGCPARGCRARRETGAMAGGYGEDLAARSGAARRASPVRSAPWPGPSYVQDLGFLLAQEVVELVDAAVRELLELDLGAVLVVAAGLALVA